MDTQTESQNTETPVEPSKRRFRFRPAETPPITTGKAFFDENLRGKDFTRADLPGANFAGSDVTDAKFWDADLREADLSEARGLLLSQLAGADLRRAMLPDSIDLQSALDHVAELSKNAGKVFLSLLATASLLMLIAYSTDDVQLITKTGTATLPVINLPISIKFFFLFGPLVLFASYIALHMYLQNLWDAIARLPAYFPDGESVDRKTYPWLVNDLARSYLFRLQKTRRTPFFPQRYLFQVLCYQIAPICSFFLWGRYLITHSWWITGLNIAVFGVSVTFGLIFFNQSKITLKKDVSQPGPWANFDNRVWMKAGAKYLAVGFLSSWVLWFLSVSAFHGINPNVQQPDDLAWITGSAGVGQIVVPEILNEITGPPFANLEQADVSTKPAGWYDQSAQGVDATSNKKAAQRASLSPNIEPSYLSQVTGAKLQSANLDQALATDAFLVNATLSGASLRAADLRGADLRWAYLSDDTILGLNAADLRGADLSEAKLDHSHLERARLQRAELAGAHIQYGHLEESHLEGSFLESADLEQADLKNAFLDDADLKGADLKFTHLERADLEYANLGGAHLENAILINADLKGADLINAQLSGAILSADLEGANLAGANLAGAHLDGANLNGANLENADLRGDTMKSIDLLGADLQHAKLDGITLDVGFYDKNTKFPLGFNPGEHGFILVNPPKPTPAKGTAKLTVKKTSN